MWTLRGTDLILASASPRRAELLAHAGIPFEVAPADVDEQTRPGEAAEAHVRRLAEAKGRAAAARAPGRAVLAADTVVVIDDQILGKPADPQDAARMLRLLSGRAHRVLTGVSLLVPAGDGGEAPRRTQLSVSQVWFVHLSDADIDWYVATGEPMDKAGAYGIQGLGSRFVERLDGSYSNVVGLPVALVYRMCTAAGILLS